jgi:hypothetical protein
MLGKSLGKPIRTNLAIHTKTHGQLRQDHSITLHNMGREIQQFFPTICSADTFWSYEYIYYHDEKIISHNVIKKMM